MNKKILVSIVIAGSMLTTPLFASNFLHQLMPGKQPARSASNLPALQHETQNYTDFSGSWAGHCSLPEGGDATLRLTIENNGTFINIEGDEYKIGSVNTESKSDNLSAEFEHTSFEWSNDLSTLTAEILTFEKIYSSYPYNKSRPMEAAVTQIAFSLNNGKLAMNGKSLDFNDLDVANFTCTLSKTED